LDQGFGIDAANISRAFNSVPHQRLIAKLEALGVRGNLSLWLLNFPSNQSFFEWPHVILGSGGEWGSPEIYSRPLDDCMSMIFQT